MLNKKSILLVFLISIFTTSHLYAKCGRCGVDLPPAPKKSSSLVTVVPESGDVEGLVIASCGMCNFGMRSRDCSLAIQISDKAFHVKGTKIDDHGDSHAKDGFCNAVRVAKVSGKVKKNVFLADSFELQKN